MPPTIFFRVPLPCSSCGSPNDARAINLYTSGLGNDPIDTSVVPGQALELEPADFADAYLTLREPRDDEPIFTALELWGCRACHRLCVARLTFRRRTPFVVEFVGAEPATLSKDELDRAHYVSRRIDEWAPQPGDDVERIAELEARARPGAR